MNRVAKFFRDYAFARFALLIGVIAIIFGCVAIGPVATRLNYPQTDATVTRAELFEAAYRDGDTEHEATYTIFVEYAVDGVEYEEEYGVFTEMKPGTPVRINYNPNDPRDIGQPNSMLLPYGIIAAGIALLIAGIVSIIRTRNKNVALRRQEEAWKHGN